VKRKQVEYARKHRAANRKPIAERACIHCGTKFWPTHGKNTQCAGCRAKYHVVYAAKNREKLRINVREYRARNRDRLRAYLVQRRRAAIEGMTPEQLASFRQAESEKTRRLNLILKDEVFTAYGGWRCACCGETERSFLSIDHMQNNGSKMRREGVHGHSTQFYRWLKRSGFPSDFQVLCMNCQFGKRMNKGVCPHQSNNV
jgi:hypothetical protein